MEVVVNNEEETEVEEMELEEWRALLVSVLEVSTNKVLEQQRLFQQEIVNLFQQLPNQTLIQTLLETNAQQNQQISGSQQAMMELLTLRLSPPEPEVIPEPAPVAVVVPEEVKTEVPETREPEVPRHNRQRI
jgi:hypothetical protein